MLEDAIKNDRTIIVIGLDDKEKYFDCITLEHQCPAMLIAGCPPEGFIEMKAEDLHNRQVHIITDVGTFLAVFLCDFFQGSSSACVISNFVGTLEVRMWGLPLTIPSPPNQTPQMASCDTTHPTKSPPHSLPPQPHYLPNPHQPPTYSNSPGLNSRVLHDTLAPHRHPPPPQSAPHRRSDLL